MARTANKPLNKGTIGAYKLLDSTAVHQIIAAAGLPLLLTEEHSAVVGVMNEITDDLLRISFRTRITKKQYSDFKKTYDQLERLYGQLNSVFYSPPGVLVSLKRWHEAVKGDVQSRTGRPLKEFDITLTSSLATLFELLFFKKPKSTLGGSVSKFMHAYIEAVRLALTSVLFESEETKTRVMAIWLQQSAENFAARIKQYNLDAQLIERSRDIVLLYFTMKSSTPALYKTLSSQP